jgi:hypothetical protein
VAAQKAPKQAGLQCTAASVTHAKMMIHDASEVYVFEF